MYRNALAQGPLVILRRPWGRVAGVIGDPPGFPYTPPGVDILEGGKLTSNNVAGSSHNPLQSFAVASGAVSKPDGDAAGQDALHSAGVE